MKRILLIIFVSAITTMATAQTKIYLSTGGKSVTATLVDNDATKELVKLLSQGDITVNMSDYGGFEKVGALPQSLPTSNTQITTSVGDIMLYQGYNMVIFYGSNSWSYTRLGKIDNATAESVREFLGNGNVSVTLSLTGNAGIDDVMADGPEEWIVYDVHGRRIDISDSNVDNLPSGIYIINGKKVKV